MRIPILATSIVSLLLLPLAGCGSEPELPKQATPMSADALLERIEAGNPPFILDVRSPEEVAAGHIPGATNIPHLELAERIAEILPYRDQEVLVHCERGGRAMAAEQILYDRGFETVYDLTGHMSEWRSRDLPIEVPEAQ